MVEVGGQLGPPSMQRPAETSEIADRTVAQVGDQPLDLGAGLVGVVEPIQVHQVLGDGPRPG